MENEIVGIDGILDGVIDGADAAFIGTTFFNESRRAVYSEAKLLDFYREQIQRERPEVTGEELDAEAADLLDDAVRGLAMVGREPVIVEPN